MKCYTVFLLSFWVLLGIWFQSASSHQDVLPPKDWSSYDSLSNKTEAKTDQPFHTVNLANCEHQHSVGWTTEGLNKGRETICWRKKIHSLFCIKREETWKLYPNGTLYNSQARNCMAVFNSKTSLPGVRSWIAKGTKGEVYLPIINESKQKTTIYTRTGYLTESFPDMKVKSCRAKDLQSGKIVAIKNGILSVDLKPRGRALLLIICQ